MRLLVKHGASLNMQDQTGHTALHHAARLRPELQVGLPIVEILVESAGEDYSSDGTTRFNG